MADRVVLFLALAYSVASLAAAQLRNVALGKYANASAFGDFYSRFPPSQVTDGNTVWDDNLSNGFHSNAGASPNWLRVYLEAVYPMTNIVIYYRKNFQDRIAGSQINIRNDTNGQAQLCATVSNRDLDNNLFRGNFSCPMSGSIVELRKDGGTLNICEVQVWECAANTYGSTCTPCGNCLNGDVCDKTHGACPGGCDPGWTGTKCGTRCSDNCAEVTCDQTTAACTRGCKPGWRGFTCNQTCEAGRFGAGCAGVCGHCPCDHVTGACTGACDSGWEGSSCNQTCQAGSYGAGCRQTCGQCLQGTCHHVTGDCTGGCQSGWRGSKCDQKCPDGTYGGNCASPCGQCQNPPCHHVNGSCFGGCVSGKTGDLCKDVCPPGTYGIGCASNCGKCLNVSCRDDGSCPGSCQNGWDGTTCNQKGLGATESLPEKPSSSPGLGAGIGIGIGIGLGVACLVFVPALLVTVVYFKRRRSQDKGRGRQQASQGDAGNAERSVYYNVVQEEPERGEKSPYSTLETATRNENVPRDCEEIRNNRKVM